MKTPRELLEAAREIIEDPSHWCQHAAARMEDGTGVTCSDERATCWCMGGALGLATIREIKAADGMLSEDEMKAMHTAWSDATDTLTRACQTIRGRAPFPIIAFNDMAQEHAQVLGAFDLAIEGASE